MSKKTRKALLVIACFMLTVSMTIAGTIAYLNASTTKVTNTFTVGSVTINLDEAKVDAYGAATTPAGRVKGNTYKLVPNHTYTKDPTVYVEAGSEPCYVFVKVVNGIAGNEVAAADGDTIAEQMETNGWKQLKVNDKNVENVYYYENVVDARTAKQTLVVFSTFTIAANATLSNYSDVTIDAYAVQKDTFADAAAAWAAASTDWGN